MRAKLLPRPPSVLRECHGRCQCAERRCSNRVVGQGLQRRLEVFRLPLQTGLSNTSMDGVGAGINSCSQERTSRGPAVKGWAVRSVDPIPEGAFVFEVLGQLLAIPTLTAAQPAFPPFFRPEDWLPSTSQPCNKESLLVDTTTFGNVGRFARWAPKGGQGNLRRQAVFVAGQNPQCPRLALFAARDICAGEELVVEPLHSDVAAKPSLSRLGASESPSSKTLGDGTCSSNGGVVPVLGTAKSGEMDATSKKKHPSVNDADQNQKPSHHETTVKKKTSWFPTQKKGPSVSVIL